MNICRVGNTIIPHHLYHVSLLAAHVLFEELFNLVFLAYFLITAIISSLPSTIRLSTLGICALALPEGHGIKVRDEIGITDVLLVLVALVQSFSQILFRSY